MSIIRLLFFRLALTTILLALATRVSHSAALDSDSGVNITRISFLIHPVCWDLALDSAGRPARSYISLISRIRGGAWYDERDFLETLAWERRVNEKQKEYIRRMGPHEALIIYPIGDRKAMTDLEETAQQQLGSRCIIIGSKPPSADEDPRAFLPEPIKAGLMDELLETAQKTGYDWSAGALKVILYNRKIAVEIQRGFLQRGLHFNPETVNMVAFGEGFEQCAMTWKAMLPYYLDVPKPIENDYELSVSGMPLLQSAKFKERMELRGDARLFLWELSDGRPMGLFVRAMARLSDEQLFATVPLRSENVEVFSEDGEEFWPAAREPNSAVRANSRTSIRIPIYAALRKTSTDRAYYTVGNDITFSEFRRALVAAAISDTR